jgi:carbonic anhydrase
MRLPKTTAHAGLLAIVLALCSFGVALAAEGVHWSYSGDTGPEHWGELSPEYAACSKGVEQSPIDIPASTPLDTSGISFSYQPSALTILNNGHTIQANYDKGSSISFHGTTYELVQFHFHAASEHTIDGDHDPLEIHFVHRSAEGKLAVVGVMLETGAENPAYIPVFQNLPPAEQEPVGIPGVTVDASQMLPAQREYWTYPGSLTTPPCSEGVTWLVMDTPVQVSGGQIAAFTSIYANNARPVQPLNSRSFVVPLTLPVTGDGVVIVDPWMLGGGVLAIISGLGVAHRARRQTI